MREAGLPKAGAILAVAAGDLNGDGRSDLVWTAETAARSSRSTAATARSCRPRRVGRRDGVRCSSTSTTTGSSTSSSARPQGPSALYRNDGAGRFAAASVGALPAGARRRGRGLSTATAISTSSLVHAGREAALFENQGGNANGWIDVALEGLPTGSAKVNRFGYGSEVEVKAQDLYVYRVGVAAGHAHRARRPAQGRRPADRLDERRPAERARPAGADGRRARCSS